MKTHLMLFLLAALALATAAAAAAETAQVHAWIIGVFADTNTTLGDFELNISGVAYLAAGNIYSDNEYVSLRVLLAGGRKLYDPYMSWVILDEGNQYRVLIDDNEYYVDKDWVNIEYSYYVQRIGWRTREYTLVNLTIGDFSYQYLTTNNIAWIICDGQCVVDLFNSTVMLVTDYTYYQNTNTFIIGRAAAGTAATADSDTVVAGDPLTLYFNNYWMCSHQTYCKLWIWEQTQVYYQGPAASAVQIILSELGNHTLSSRFYTIGDDNRLYGFTDIDYLNIRVISPSSIEIFSDVTVIVAHIIAVALTIAALFHPSRILSLVGIAIVILLWAKGYINIYITAMLLLLLVVDIFIRSK